MSQELKNDSLS